MLRTVGFAAVGVAAACAALAVSDHFPSKFRRLDEGAVARCEPVSGLGPIIGAAAAGDQHIYLAVTGRERGAIYRFNPGEPLAQDNWRDRTGGAPAEFAPAGIDYFESGDVKRLFVVNRAAKSVDIFSIEPEGGATLVASHNERRLTYPVAVAATGPDSFYVINDARRAGPAIFQTGLKLGRHKGGEVMYQHEGVWRVAASGFAFASTIAASPDARVIVVGEEAANRARTYMRDPEGNSLSETAVIELPGAPQSIMATDNGFSAAIRDARLRSMFFPSARARAGSAVVTLDLEGSSKVLFHSRDSRTIVAPVSASASTTRHLLLGSALSETSLLCAMSD